MKVFLLVFGVAILIVIGIVVFVYFNQPKGVLPYSYANPPATSKTLPSLSFATISPSEINQNDLSVVGSDSFGIWKKDSAAVYYFQNARGDAAPAQIIKIQGADPNTFSVIASSSGVFYKDANYVYFFTGQGGSFGVTTTPEVDAATFSAISAGYFKDKSSVYYFDAYWNWAVVQGADPVTFQYIGKYDFSGGVGYATSVGKDKNCIYRGTYKILDSNKACISPNTCTSSSLASNPASCGITTSPSSSLLPIQINQPATGTQWGVGTNVQIAWMAAVPWNAAGNSRNDDQGSFVVQLISPTGDSLPIASGSAAQFKISEGDVYSQFRTAYAIPGNATLGQYSLTVTQYLGNDQTTGQQYVIVGTSTIQQIPVDKARG